MIAKNTLSRGGGGNYKFAVAAVALCAAGVFAEDVYYAVSGVSAPYYWSYETAWKSCHNGNPLLNRCPGPEDNVWLNSSALSIGTPLTVNSEAHANKVWIAQDEAHTDKMPAVKIVSGGALHVLSSGDAALSVAHAAGGKGVLLNDGGTVDTGTLSVGENGTGVMTNYAGTVSVSNRLIVGQNADSDGLFYQAGGEVKLVNNWKGNYVDVGQRGRGTYIHAGGTTSTARFGIGMNAGGDGHVIVQADGFDLTNSATLYVGVYGHGEMTVEPGVTARQTYLKIGGNMDCVSRLTLEANATNVVYLFARVGGYAYVPWENDPSDSINLNGLGEIVMRGGVLAAKENTSSILNLIVSDKAAGNGVVRGWGEFRGVAPGADNNNFRMANNGRVIADGEGVHRLLDLSRVISSTNQVANGLTGTNGWYAVNKGRLAYPRTYKSAAAAAENPSFAVGEVPNTPESELDLVNSLRVTFAGINANSTLRADLYAVDRDDYPAGLPVGRHRHALGVWAIWLQESHASATRRSFATADVQIRYDHRPLKPGVKVKMWRHTGTGNWTEVACQTVAEANPVPRISSGAKPRVEGGAGTFNAADGLVANVGWYAVTYETDSGALLLFR